MENYRQALTRYRAASGPAYRRPCNIRSTYGRDGWHLRTMDGDLVAIVTPERVVLGDALERHLLDRIRERLRA
jgi:hypothetical protein